MVVDVDIAEDMGGGASPRIESLYLRTETDCWNSKPQNLVLLFRGQLAPQPREVRSLI